MSNYYDILQVRPGAEDRVIRESYVVLMGVYHPDRSNGDRNFTNFHAARINEAYSVLGDPAKRAIYDAALAEGSRKWIGRTAHRAGHFVAARMARGANLAQGLRNPVRRVRADAAVIGRSRSGISPLWILPVAPLLAVFLLIPRPDAGNQEPGLSASTPGASAAIAAAPEDLAASSIRQPDLSEPIRPRRTIDPPAAPKARIIPARLASARPDFSDQAEVVAPVAVRTVQPQSAVAAAPEPLPILASARPVPVRAAPSADVAQAPARDEKSVRRACFPLLVNQGAQAYNACLAQR